MSSKEICEGFFRKGVAKGAALVVRLKMYGSGLSVRSDRGELRSDWPKKGRLLLAVRSGINGVHASGGASFFFLGRTEDRAGTAAVVRAWPAAKDRGRRVGG